MHVAFKWSHRTTPCELSRLWQLFCVAEYGDFTVGTNGQGHNISHGYCLCFISTKLTQNYCSKVIQIL